MKRQLRTSLERCLVTSAFIATAIQTDMLVAEERSALDPDQHAADAAYLGDFDKPIVPLDVTLPWRDRFQPGGAFDPQYSLETAGARPSAGSEVSESTADEANNALDARGIVRDVRAESGKLKIEHGPIDRHGMPSMTMMFNVADPSMIDAVSKGDEIEFNVDMGASGFTITEIRRSGGSQ